MIELSSRAKPSGCFKLNKGKLYSSSPVWGRLGGGDIIVDSVLSMVNVVFIPPPIGGG